MCVLQPADWDDREYIDDPNAVKPEVLKLAISILYDHHPFDLQ